MVIEQLMEDLNTFAAEREWGRFHTPKNLVMALSGEVGELVEVFQWLTPEESVEVMTDDRRASQVRDELADVFGYILRLADILDVDLESSLRAKMRANAAKYPVESSRGVATKYTELRGGSA